MPMPMAMAKSSLRSVASLCSRAAKLGTRSFSSAARYDEAYEAEKWEKISIAGIVTCAVLSIYNLSKSHHEHPEPPPYPYLRIQKKDFPWGPEPLTEHIKKSPPSSSIPLRGCLRPQQLLPSFNKIIGEIKKDIYRSENI